MRSFSDCCMRKSSSNLSLDGSLMGRLFPVAEVRQAPNPWHGSFSMEQVVIMGTGCAALTAAIYTARANLAPLVLTGAMPGGLLTTTCTVENFPGFPEGIDGFQLMQNLQKQ